MFKSQIVSTAEQSLRNRINDLYSRMAKDHLTLAMHPDLPLTERIDFHVKQKTMHSQVIELTQTLQELENRPRPESITLDFVGVVIREDRDLNDAALYIALDEYRESDIKLQFIVNKHVTIPVGFLDGLDVEVHRWNREEDIQLIIDDLVKAKQVEKTQ